MGKFMLGDIFAISTPKQKFNASSVIFGGKYPYIARGSGNNGVRGYITEDTKYLNEGNTISFGQDTSTMFYQPSPYFTGDKIKVLTPKKFNLNRYIALYYIVATKKILKTFSWGSTSFKVENLENIEVEVPICDLNDFMPDTNFMETVIKALEKLVIKDAVNWQNKKIEAIKEVIKNKQEKILR
jgi:putative type II site-specific deoxyribonuclease